MATIIVYSQGWPTQLHHWANISAPILKRAAKLMLMTRLGQFFAINAKVEIIVFLITLKVKKVFL